MGIKIGNIDASYFKVGNGDCSIYLGATLLYSGGTTPPTPPTPTFQGKWLATYDGGTTSSAECDSTSAITSGEINLTNLVGVEIGDCVTSIGNWVFDSCTSLSSVTIPNSVTSIGNGAFYACRSLTSIIIPNGVTSINYVAFYNCSGLTSVSIPNTVTSIDQQAFYNSTSLTSVTIPDSITSIGDYAFDWSSSLTSITIGSGITSIGAEVFNGCSSLTSVTITATTPPTIDYGVFNDTNNCPIYVLANSVNTYKTATNWSTYASRIQAIPNS